MKTAICILLVVVALFGIASLIGAWLKLCAERDTKLLTEDPNKPPSVAVERQTTFEDLLDAIEFVESGGDPDAVGDSGQAVGSFQIHKIYVDDVNRILGLRGLEYRFTYEDRRDSVKSREMVRIYLLSWCNRYTLSMWKLRIGAGDETKARIHNAGPEGWRNDPEWFVRNRGYSLEQAKDKIANAKAYWAKVEARLERE